MKKFGKILVFLLLIIPIKINAAEITLDCNPVTAKSGSNIACNVNATSAYYVSGFSADIELSSNLNFISFKKDNSWEGSATSNKIGLYTSDNKKDTFQLGVLTISVKENVFDVNETISLINCVYSDSNFKSIKLKDVSTKIRVPSSNNKLSNLQVLPGTIDFNPDTLNYNISVDSKTVDISAVSENKNATISGDIGNKNLNYGTNVFKINVTSETGEVRTYTINVTRNDNRSGNSKLSSLSVGNYNINFKEDVYNYNINVDYNVTSVKINAKLSDNKSSFVSGYGSREVKLNEGLNKYEVKITAENGTVSTYTLNITRGEDPENKSNDNYLENIHITDNNIEFSKEQLEYKVTVGYDTNSLDINSIASSNKSKVEVFGNENFSVGENIVTIKVTSQNGEVREYKIIVNKKDKILSNNNYLKSITITNYEIKFDKETSTYNLKIKDEEILEINAIPEDEKSSIAITGNENLKNKSIIKISVTSEDGSVREYNINIKKNKEVNWLAIVIIIESIIVIGVISFFIAKKKKDKFYEDFK